MALEIFVPFEIKAGRDASQEDRLRHSIPICLCARTAPVDTKRTKVAKLTKLSCLNGTARRVGVMISNTREARRIAGNASAAEKAALFSGTASRVHGVPL